MTYWDKVINQNKMDSSLISELSDYLTGQQGGNDNNQEEQKKIL